MKTHEKTPVEAGALREQPAPIVTAPDARQLVAATIAEHGLDWPRGMQARLAKQAGCSAANISRLLKQAKAEGLSSAPVCDADKPGQAAADPVPAPSSSNGNGHHQGGLRVLEPVVSAEPAPEPIPADPARAERTRLLPRHRKILLASAITEERIGLWESISKATDLPPELRSWGSKAVPCMATTWRTVSGARVVQIRLDTPIPGADGRPIRYLFQKGSGGIVGTDPAFERDWANAHIPLLLVEGTKQFQAAASTINPAVPFAVPFGLAGCWGWSHDLKPSADLLALPVEGRDVLVAFDADVASKWMVWEAARRLEKYLLGELMARSVRFLINPGTGGESDGLDDLLGRQPTPERRVKLLRHLIDTAIEHRAIKPPKRPAKLSAFFDGSNFKPASCWEYLSGEHDLAMSGD